MRAPGRAVAVFAPVRLRVMHPLPIRLSVESVSPRNVPGPTVFPLMFAADVTPSSPLFLGNRNVRFRLLRIKDKYLAGSTDYSIDIIASYRPVAQPSEKPAGCRRCGAPLLLCCGALFPLFKRFSPACSGSFAPRFFYPDHTSYGLSPIVRTFFLQSGSRSWCLEYQPGIGFSLRLEIVSHIDCFSLLTDPCFSCPLLYFYSPCCCSRSPLLDFLLDSLDFH